MVVLSKGGRETASNGKAKAADIDKDAGDALFTSSLARGLMVLEAFAQQPGPMSLSEIAGIAGLNKSAVQRLAHTLLKLGYLERHKNGLTPGRRVLDRAYDYLKGSPLIRRSVPVLANLRTSFNERVDLSLFDDLTIMYVSRMHGKPEMSHAHLIGRRLPTYCTAGGRAIMSHLPESEVLDILERSDRRKLTSRTATEIADILSLVEQAREDGFAISVEELLIGDITVAAAVLDAKGRPVGAVHLGAGTADWSPEEFARRAGPLALTAARELSGD